MPALIVRPCQPGDAPVGVPRFEVLVHGYANPSPLKLMLWEMKNSPFTPSHAASRSIAKIKVTLAEEAKPVGIAKIYKFVGPTLDQNKCSATGQNCDGPEIELVFPPGNAPLKIKLPHLWPGDAATDPKRSERDEGDSWYLKLALYPDDESASLLDSPSFVVGVPRRALPSRKNWDTSRATYNWHAGNDVKFYNDASEDQTGTAGAFHDMKDAIAGAKRFIFVVDWSFHPYARITQNPPPASLGDTIGAILVTKAKAMKDAGLPFLVAIHTWDHTSPAREVPNEAGDAGLDAIANQLLMGAKRPDNVLWRASNRTGEGGTSGFGFSHHQKFLIVDSDARDGSNRRELRAFYGGLDLTKGRFDWGTHVIDPDVTKCFESFHFRDQLEGRVVNLSDKLRRASTYEASEKEQYDDWYNAEFGGDRSLPRQPWHDVHAQIAGPAVWDMVREFVGRWNLDKATPGCRGDGTSTAGRVTDLFYDAMMDRTKFVQQWERAIGGWSAQVLRSQCKIHWTPDALPKARGAGATLKGQHQRQEEFKWPLKTIVRKWGSDYEMESSIQDAYLRVVKQAERFIYIETQYLLGSGLKWGRNTLANKVPETVVERIIERVNAGKPFHAYFLLPMFPEGKPADMYMQKVKEIQWNTIQWMISHLNSQLPGVGQDKWKKYLSFYFLAQWHDLTAQGGPNTAENDREKRVANNRRYMIYVHSKLMIIDDRYVMLGSANLNERSLHGGRDSEICLHVWPTAKQHVAPVEQEVKRLRKRLWREHFGHDLSDAHFNAPEKSGCVDQVKLEADQNFLDLYAGVRNGPDMTTWPHICRWPIELKPDNKIEFRVGGDNVTYRTLVDAPTTKSLFARNVIPDDAWYWDTSITAPMDLPE